MKLFVVWVWLSFVLSAVAQEDGSMKLVEDVPYLSGEDFEGERHTLDLYLPDTDAPFPILVFWHGGAWVGGSKSSVMGVGMAFVREGIGVVVPNYRLSPLASHPDHVRDAAAALAWTMEHIADYGGDPQRVMIGGHSAGAHLASLLALEPHYLDEVGVSINALDGVVALSGVFWIDDWIMNWAKGAFSAEEDKRRAASPYYQVATMEHPLPFLLLISDSDYPQLIVESDAMYGALTRAQIPARLVMIPERDHYSLVGKIAREDDRAAATILTWMRDVWSLESSVR